MKKISDIYASIGTIVVSIIVLLILLFCGISTSRDPIDEGLMVVSYGDVDDGYGTPEEPQTQSTKDDLWMFQDNTQLDDTNNIWTGGY